MSDTLNETAKPETPDVGAQMDADLAEFDSDVERLAREFDEGVTPKDDPAEPTEQDALATTEAGAAAFDPAQSDSTFEADLQEAADFREATGIVSGHLEGLGLSEMVIEHVMRGINPEKNPVLARAWERRAEAPELLERELKTFARDLRGSFEGPIDQVEMDTTEAVSAAVRFASTKTQEADPLTRDAWRKMSPEDQRKAQSDLGVRPV